MMFYILLVTVKTTLAVRGKTLAKEYAPPNQAVHQINTRWPEMGS
jgi:hypothetical protein